MNLNTAFKALAYPALHLPLFADPVSPCPCSLIFRCDDAAKQATLLLATKIPTAHAGATLFVLQYDADTLEAGTVRLTSGSARAPQLQLDEILRDKSDKHTDIKTLALSVEQPRLWCPDGAAAFGPQPGCESAFRQLAGLAKATAVHIVFDYKHLRKEHRGMFKAFSKGARGLAGYPVDSALAEHGLSKASWEVFGPADAAGAPPAYEGARLKRPRQASPSSPTQSKRFAAQSPAKSDSSGQTEPLSPATAEAIRAALRKSSPGFDFQTEAINSAIERQLSAHLDKAEALQNTAIDAAVAKQVTAYFEKALHTPTIHAAVDKQLPAHLGAILPALLPDTLETLIAGAPTSEPVSPATSLTSADSRGNQYPKLPPLTPIGRTMLPHLRTHLTSQFAVYQSQQLQRFTRVVDKTFDQVERSAYDSRAREAAEFEAELEEHRAQLGLISGDAVSELWRETEDALARGQQEGAALAEWICSETERVCETIEGIKKVRLRRMVARAVRTREKRGFVVGGAKKGARGVRALLGRKRGEDEWVDC